VINYLVYIKWLIKVKKAKSKSKSKTQALLNNKILINIIMDKVGKRKSRAKSKSKSKAKSLLPAAEPKVAAGSKHSLPQPEASVQNQLAYINNLSLMNRVQPRMF
jgi:hypothetical protein